MPAALRAGQPKWRDARISRYTANDVSSTST